MAMDNLAAEIMRVVKSAGAPLETKEIETALNEKLHEPVSRSKLLYRLNNLRAEQQIEGKFVGSGKGAWIWWNTEAFKKEGRAKRGQEGR